MLQRFLSTGIVFCAFMCANAQNAAIDSLAPKALFEISGSVDAYFRYDVAQNASNNKTSFTNAHNSFELGMATVKMSHSFKKVGMTADIGFGKRAEDFAYTDERTRFIIKQLYLNYSLKNGIKLTAGSWATHIGIESVDAYINRNYSMSYMFSYGPFSHTGIKAEKTLGRTGLMLGVANPTDFRSAFEGTHKYLIGQISNVNKNEKIKTYLNFQGGKPNDTTRVSQIDVVASYDVSKKFNVSINGTLTNLQAKTTETDFGDMQQWYGAAVYLNANPSEKFGVTLRSEFFNDKKQLNVFASQATGGNILANTLSFILKKDNLSFVPEIRFEKASTNLFLDKDGAGKDTAFSFLIASYYKF
jgi:hypothetical protein